MHFPFKAAGFEGRKLAVVFPTFFGGAELHIDGKQAPPAETSGEWLLVDNQQQDRVATMKQRGLFLDPVPRIIIGTETYDVVESLKWYNWLWAGLPLLFVFLGGCIPAMLGIMALWINGRLLRSEMSGVATFFATGGVSAVAIILIFISAAIIQSLL